MQLKLEVLLSLWIITSIICVDYEELMILQDLFVLVKLLITTGIEIHALLSLVVL